VIADLEMLPHAAPPIILFASGFRIGGAKATGAEQYYDAQDEGGIMLTGRAETDRRTPREE
jgi:hypothetical protein